MLERIKGLRRELQFYFKFGVRIQRLRRKNKKLYVCVGSAVHGNMGDQALGFCRIELLKKLGINEEVIIEYTTRDRMRYWPQICKIHKAEDIIIVRGGGFWGDLWIDGFQEILLYIEKFSLNKIIVFPQSVFFSSTVEGNKWLQYSKKIVNQCKNLYIVARDISSYTLLKNYYPDSIISVSPDTVLSYYPEGLEKKRQLDVLLCLRSDKEKKQDSITEDEMITFLEREKKTFILQDTVVDFNLKNLKERKAKLFETWEKFANSKLVVTDRLHGMIFSVITETPCIVFDNIDGKVGNQYEWVKQLDYVFFVDNKNEFMQAWKKAVHFSNVKYPVENMMIQYRELFNIINKN